MFTQLNTFDLIFVLSAVAFNLLIAAIFIAQKLGRDKLVKTFGILWLWLLVPLAAGICGLLAGRERYADSVLFWFDLPVHVGGVAARLRFQDSISVRNRSRMCRTSFWNTSRCSA